MPTREHFAEYLKSLGILDEPFFHVCTKELITRKEDFAFFTPDEIKVLGFSALNTRKIIKVLDDETAARETAARETAALKAKGVALNVSGAGSAEVNGYYKRDGNYNGKPRFCKVWCIEA